MFKFTFKFTLTFTSAILLKVISWVPFVWYATYSDLNLQLYARIVPRSCPGVGLGGQRVEHLCTLDTCLVVSFFVLFFVCLILLGSFFVLFFFCSPKIMFAIVVL